MNSRGQLTAWIIAAAIAGAGATAKAGAPAFDGGLAGGLEHLEPVAVEKIEPSRLSLDPDAEVRPFFADDNPEHRDPRPVPNGIGRYGPLSGDWEATLTGVAANDGRFKQGGFAVQGSIGHYLMRPLLLDLRQSVGFEDFGDAAWSGSTHLAANWHFDLFRDRLRPFVGASVGGFYGEQIRDTASLGLEGGAKFYVKPDTFLFGRIEHHWLLDRADRDDRVFGKRRFLYTIGIGFNF